MDTASRGTFLASLGTTFRSGPMNLDTWLCTENLAHTYGDLPRNRQLYRYNCVTWARNVSRLSDSLQFL